MDGARTINPNIDKYRAAPSFCRPSRGVARCGIWGKTMRENKETEMLLRLMRAALHQEFETPIPWETGCDAEKLNVLIRRQSLVTMVYPVIARQSGDGWESLREGMKDFFARETHRSITQEYEIGWLLDEMEASGIDCLPMKGWVIRNYYPDPLMRSMTDFDVLLREVEHDKMLAWMKTRGYNRVKMVRQYDDEYEKPPYMYVELHWHLFYEGGEVEQQQERTVWQEDDREPGTAHRYRLREEDLYIHCMSHFYKHFTSSGVGIRFLADIYLLQKQLKMDRSYVEAMFAQMKILGFARRLEQVALSCFEGQAMDEQTKLIVDYLTEAGVHGSLELNEALYTVKKGEGAYGLNRLCTFWQRCFPDLTFMQAGYPRLNRQPWLMPFYWGIRIFRIVFLQNERVRAMARYQTKKEYDRLKEIYDAAGIDEK